MNYNDISHYYANKKRGHSSDDYYTTTSLPRKKFISEENFARDMAAMSIDPNNACKVVKLFVAQTCAIEPLQTKCTLTFCVRRLDFDHFGHPTLNTSFKDRNTANVIHIDDMDRFLKEDDVETSKKRDHKYKIMHTILNGKTVYDSDVNGLPLEMRAGESKPRIPEFVLKNTSLTDPRDKLAYEQLLKSIQRPHLKQARIEVLNGPSTNYTPTAMDID